MRRGGRTFWENVNRTDSCWLWIGCIEKDGYGVYRFNKRQWRAHRFSYEMHIGPIPEGLVIDHLCRVRNCVNPEHLEPVTALENLQRGARPPGMSHCMYGHEFTPENTYVEQSGARRRRHCKACTRRRGRQYAAQRRQESANA